MKLEIPLNINKVREDTILGAKNRREEEIKRINKLIEERASRGYSYVYCGTIISKSVAEIFREAGYKVENKYTEIVCETTIKW